MSWDRGVLLGFVSPSFFIVSPSSSPPPLYFSSFSLLFAFYLPFLCPAARTSPPSCRPPAPRQPVPPGPPRPHGTAGTHRGSGPIPGAPRQLSLRRTRLCNSLLTVFAVSGAGTPAGTDGSGVRRGQNPTGRARSGATGPSLPSASIRHEGVVGSSPGGAPLGGDTPRQELPSAETPLPSSLQQTRRGARPRSLPRAGLLARGRCTGERSRPAVPPCPPSAVAAVPGTGQSLRARPRCCGGRPGPCRGCPQRPRGPGGRSLASPGSRCPCAVREFENEGKKSK